MTGTSWTKVKTPREIASAKKKAHVFSCALELFKEYGYDNITVKDIAAKSDINEGSIYNFFGSKAGILTGLENHLRNATYPLIEMTQENLSNPTDAIYRYLMAYGKCFSDIGPELTSRYYLNGKNINIRTDSTPLYFLGCHMEDLFAFIQKAKDIGSLKTVIPVEEISTILLTTCNGLVTTWVLFNGSYSLLEVSSSILDRVIHTYLHNMNE